MQPTDMARALGLGTTLTHAGVTYRVSPWTYEIQAEYSRFLRKCALDAVLDMAEYLGREEVKESRREIAKDLTTYRFGSPHCFDTLQDEKKLAYLFYLQTRDVNQGMTLDRALAVVRECPRVADALFEANVDPSKAPKTKTAEATPEPRPATP